MNKLNHLAIIMDGNGRWAKQHSYPKAIGHKNGANNAKRILESCIQLKIPHLTLYALSQENFLRPQEEISNITSLLEYYLTYEINDLHSRNIKLKFIGSFDNLTDSLKEKIYYAEHLTSLNSEITLYIAIGYGSTQELVYAVNKLLTSSPSKITYEDIKNNFYTQNMPDVDLLIRTGGDQRLSNFLLLQSSYAEIYFSKTLWPDFSSQELVEIVNKYQNTVRNFGQTRQD
jgi:undecaprenyl diphosphate synthase